MQESFIMKKIIMIPGFGFNDAGIIIFAAKRAAQDSIRRKNHDDVETIIFGKRNVSNLPRMANT